MSSSSNISGLHPQSTKNIFIGVIGFLALLTVILFIYGLVLSSRNTADVNEQNEKESALCAQITCPGAKGGDGTNRAAVRKNTQGVCESSI